MSRGKIIDGGVNPPTVTGFGNEEEKAAEKAALREYFKHAGTPEAFFAAYPGDRPPESLPRAKTHLPDPALARIAAMMAENDPATAAPFPRMNGLER
jgi:hypothetical protein